MSNANKTNSVKCPNCSRSPGAGHHDDCPSHPRAIEKVVAKKREEAARAYVLSNAVDEKADTLLAEAAFEAGALWAVSQLGHIPDET